MCVCIYAGVNTHTYLYTYIHTHAIYLNLNSTCCMDDDKGGEKGCIPINGGKEKWVRERENKKDGENGVVG